MTLLKRTLTWILALFLGAGLLSGCAGGDSSSDPAGSADVSAPDGSDTSEQEEPLDLSAVTDPYTFTVEGPGGFTNTILVEPGRIRVSQANCPDQVCVEMGAISDGTVPIVCLPHKLVIEIVGVA